MPAPSANSPPPAAHHLWLDRGCGAASFVAPFAVATAHVNGASFWRDDGLLLRGLAGVGLGPSGAVSTLLAAASYWVPLGSLHFRMGLVGALVLGAAGFAVYALTRGVLGRHEAVPILTPVLALIAALLTTLSLAGQTEGALLGVAGPALLLGVLVWDVILEPSLEQPARAVRLGVFAGALAAESALSAAVVIAGVVATAALGDSRWRRTPVLLALGAAVFSAGFLLAPVYVRGSAHAPFLALYGSIGALRGAPSLPALRSFGGVFPRLLEEGIALVSLGVVGIFIGLAKRRLRDVVVPFAIVVLAYLASMAGEGRLVAVEEVARLRLLAIAALAAGAAIGVSTMATTLLAWRLPMGRSAVVLLVMTELTLAVAGAEETSFLADRSEARGADAFIDETWSDLPRGAVVLVRSRRSTWRFWAARLFEGARPDVIVVPVSAAGEGRLALALLRAEPMLQKVLYDIVLEGRPGEEALTVLSDARPLFVELDPSWDRRVLSHLVPDRGWLRFTPEPRGASDRKAAYADLRARALRVLVACKAADKPDVATSDMVRARLVDAAALAAFLGDREEAALLGAQIGTLPGGELFAAELAQKLTTTKSGPIDVKGLLR